MHAQISKWGNSLALRIPKAYAANLGFEDGVSVSVYENDGKLIIERQQESLSDLVSKITPENLHGEAAFGAPIGHEEW